MGSDSVVPHKVVYGEQSSGEENPETTQTTPSWSGFNSLLFPDTTRPTVIGYCPMINESSTEFSTVYTVMKKAQTMCASLDQEDVVITSDLAIYVANTMEISRRVSRHNHKNGWLPCRFKFPCSFW